MDEHVRLSGAPVPEDIGVEVGDPAFDTGTPAAGDLRRVEDVLRAFHRDIHRGRRLGIAVGGEEARFARAARRHAELVGLVRSGL